jgi:two-component system response regulator RegA
VHPEIRIVMMTGYASVASAVDAIKRGAEDYLVKPVGVDAILKAIHRDEDSQPRDGEPRDESMIPLHRIEWEHIQQAMRQTDGNVSAAARMLGVHRRSLQRKLARGPGN